MADQAPGHAPPQGTEYTLQGVMRFLQVEWHNHERARNAWDIERAELKAKIAKQEGDHRNAKKLNATLDKHVRLLENALRRERAQKSAAGPPPYQEATKEPNGNAVAPNGPTIDALEQAAKELSSDAKGGQREQTKVFLQKCVEELTYILTPPANPPPPLPEAPSPQALKLSRDEIIAQQQQMRQNQQAGVSNLPSMPNHHPPPIRQHHEFVNSNAQQSHPMSRQPSHPPPNQPPPLPDEFADMRMRERPDDGDRRLFDREVTTRTEEIDAPADDGDWNFDDNSEALQDELAHRSDVDMFPSANSMPAQSPTRTSLQSRRRSSGSQRRKPSDGSHEIREMSNGEASHFRVRFALRGHLDIVRAVIFTGGGSPSEPEVCTASDDGTLKRWILPANYSSFPNGQHANHQAQDLDIQSYFTHRGHEGVVTSLAACPPSPSFSTGGRAVGDGWVFSGGSDATIRVWERGRVDPKATIDGHTDAIWALCVLPAPAVNILGSELAAFASSDHRIVLVSGSADHTIRVWAVTAPPQISSPQPAGGARRGVGGTRRHSITSGSNFPSSPQPSIASNTTFNWTLIHSITLPESTSPTCIIPLGPSGDKFLVGATDSTVIVFDTRTGEQVASMASSETYDGSPATGVTSVAFTSAQIDVPAAGGGASLEDGEGGATGSSKSGGVEGVVISGHEDRFVRFYDANSGEFLIGMR